MVIDLILNRKDGQVYFAHDFYVDVMEYGFKSICRAMDFGTESDVKKALKDYIRNGNYNPAIMDYIDRVSWLSDDDYMVAIPKRDIEFPWCGSLYVTLREGKEYVVRYINNDIYYVYVDKAPSANVGLEMDELQEFFHVQTVSGLHY